MYTNSQYWDIDGYDITMKNKYVWLNQSEIKSVKQFHKSTKLNMGTEHKKIVNENSQNIRPSKKIKRFRSAFTTHQINYLETEFKNFPYIGTIQRKEVAAALKISERAVKIWFQNRRMKEKKEINIKELDNGRYNRKMLEVTEEQPSVVNCVPSNIENPSISLPIITNYLDDDKKINYNIERMIKEKNITVMKPIKDSNCEALYNNYINDPKVTLRPTFTLCENSQSHKTPSVAFSIGLCNKTYKNKNDNIDNVTHFQVQLKNPELLPNNQLIEKKDGNDVIPEDLSLKNQKVLVQKKQMDDCGEENNSSKKIKRFRNAFTTEQISCLEKEFKRMQYISHIQRKEVAAALKIPESAVKIWFQNRRMKEKKESNIKEYDEEQTSRKMIEFTKEQLTAVNDVQLTNEQLLATDLDNVINSNNDSKIMDQEINIVNVKESVTKRPEELVYKVPNNASSFIAENSNILSKYKVLPECSFNLCKDNEEIQYKHQKLSSINDLQFDCHQETPQDLSAKKQNSSQIQNTQPNLTNLPWLSNFYTNTYTPSGGVLWKPINILPVIPGGCSVPLYSNNSGNLHLAQEQHFQKVSCNCDCHVKTDPVPMFIQQNSTSPQFIITALPISTNIHNPSYKTNI